MSSRGILIETPLDVPHSPLESGQSMDSFKLPISPPASRSTSISFAPLPDNIKRAKSNGKKRPLGVAGRSVILQQQQKLRRRRDSHEGDNGHTPAHYNPRKNEGGADDDPLNDLGKIMKEAGKKIWNGFCPRRPQVKPAEDLTVSLPQQHAVLVEKGDQPLVETVSEDASASEKDAAEVDLSLGGHVQTIDAKDIHILTYNDSISSGDPSDDAREPDTPPVQTSPS